MVIDKLQEALAEIGAQRKALDRVENQIRSMISDLSGMSEVISLTPVVSRIAAPASIGRDRDKLDDIADVLRVEGTPLHITAIAERLSKVYGKQVDRTSIEP